MSASRECIALCSGREPLNWLDPGIAGQFESAVASSDGLGHQGELDSLAVGCRFEPAVGGTSEALRVAVLPIREGKCLPGVFAPNGQ